MLKQLGRSLFVCCCCFFVCFFVVVFFGGGVGGGGREKQLLSEKGPEKTLTFDKTAIERGPCH